MRQVTRGSVWGLVFLVVGFMSMVPFAVSAQSSTMPVPLWQPDLSPPIPAITDRMQDYFGTRYDFVIFAHGTIVVLEQGLTDTEAVTQAKGILEMIIGFHPDMRPARMKDGNVLVQYNHPAFNLVLRHQAEENWPEIEARHLDGLTPDEVLVTPLGPNKFDDLGKMALLGRAQMFMDARDPVVAQIVRSIAP